MKIESLGGEYSEYTGKPRLITNSERIRRASKGFAIGLTLAILATPFPGVHFILVPAFLFYAIYAAMARFADRHSIDLSCATCPMCGSEIGEKMRFYKQLPLKLFCFKCRSQLRLKD